MVDTRYNPEHYLYQDGRCPDERWWPQFHTWSDGVGPELPGRQGAPVVFMGR